MTGGLCVVGERYYLGPGLIFRRSVPGLELTLAYHLHLGAFRRGTTATRLIASGVPAWAGALNLLNPAACGEWDSADRRRARAVAEALEPQLRRVFAVVLLCGSNVCAAFGLGHTGPLQLRGSFASYPHPSGQNRWWNPAANRAAARRFCELHLPSRQLRLDVGGASLAV